MCVLTSKTNSYVEINKFIEELKPQLWVIQTLDIFSMIL